MVPSWKERYRRAINKLIPSSDSTGKSVAKVRKEEPEWGQRI